MELTDSQRSIVDQIGNCVVLAAPGSGKTFVISEKIRLILQGDFLRDYQGIIAISYTRKAAKNLKDRVFSSIPFNRNSYFGTIDGFCFSEIVSPFLPHIWGKIQSDIQVKALVDIDADSQGIYEWIKAKKYLDYISGEQWGTLQKLYTEKGYVLVESLELLACLVINKCNACCRYLKARYRYVFIDEYQDADIYTSMLFNKMVSLGLVGIAVGDANQSIFGFDKKDCKYLQALVERDDFHSFILDKNFRCSPSIINYSNKLMGKDVAMLPSVHSDVHLVRVNGEEKATGKFLSNYIIECCERYKVSCLSSVVVLARTNQILDLIAMGLSLPYRKYTTTGLDSESNLRCTFYGSLLRYYFDSNLTFREVIDEFADFEMFTRYEQRRLMQLKKLLNSLQLPKDREAFVAYSIQLANIILPNVSEGLAAEILKKVIENTESLESYKPILDNQVNLMTLHKSKGLEFDIVFHLNLHEWVLPNKHPINNDFNHCQYSSWIQDLDLHYVGITRAKKACFFVVSNKRMGSQGRIVSGKDSEFLTLNGVDKFRD